MYWIELWAKFQVITGIFAMSIVVIVLIAALIIWLKDRKRG